QCSSGAASEGVALMKPSDSEADKAFASGAPRKPAQLSASFWLPELRNQISSYLDVPALCAQRATARENYSPKAFVAHLVQLVRPETPDAIVAAADIVYNKEKLPARECAQVFARDRFQLFARVLNAECDQLMVMARMNVGALRSHVHLRRRRTGFSTMGQTVVLGASLNVFDDLDWGALRLKQMFAAEIIRLETESHHPSQVLQTHVLARYASLPFGLKAAPELRHEKAAETGEAAAKEKPSLSPANIQVRVPREKESTRAQLRPVTVQERVVVVGPALQEEKVTKLLNEIEKLKTEPSQCVLDFRRIDLAAKKVEVDCEILQRWPREELKQARVLVSSVDAFEKALADAMDSAGCSCVSALLESFQQLKASQAEAQANGWHPDLGLPTKELLITMVVQTQGLQRGSLEDARQLLNKVSSKWKGKDQANQCNEPRAGERAKEAIHHAQLEEAQNQLLHLMN
ncbi:unnamed protein product, partial [Cladocopium goreaui]